MTAPKNKTINNFFMASPFGFVEGYGGLCFVLVNILNKYVSKEAIPEAHLCQGKVPQMQKVPLLTSTLYRINFSYPFC